MNIHIMSNDKFTEPYINFINTNFKSNDHFFFIYTKDNSEMNSKDDAENIFRINLNFKSLWILIKYLNKNDKIFIHGLNSSKLLYMLFLQPWILKKCNWIILGSDLYSYKNKKNTLKGKTHEYIKHSVIKNIDGLVTPVKGDYELAKCWYGAKGKYYYSFLYPSNLYKKYNISKIDNDNQSAYIQIGNSADPSNGHIEIFDEISALNIKDFELFCPLSYGGSKEYKDKVVKRGLELFGKKFNYLLEYVTFEQYLEKLSRIDVAIFNHDRQQAVGNITTLLSLGKKVYIREDITTWNFCEDHELRVYSVNNEINELSEPLPEEIKQRNIQRMKVLFSKEKLISDWEKIFSKKE